MQSVTGLLGVVLGGAIAFSATWLASRRAWQAVVRTEIRILAMKLFTEAGGLLSLEDKTQERRGYSLADVHDVPADNFLKGGGAPYRLPLERANQELGLVTNSAVRKASRDYVDAIYVVIWGTGRRQRQKNEIPELAAAEERLEGALRRLLGS